MSSARPTPAHPTRRAVDAVDAVDGADAPAAPAARPDDGLALALTRIPSRLQPQPSAAERVAAALREQIVDGVLRSGTRLTEEAISSAIGYSRNTIREAYALLMAERLVVREANRGVFVVTPTAQDVRDLYATRQLLEPAAIEHGQHLTPELLATMRRIVDTAAAGRDAGDAAAIAQGNQLLHRAIIQISGSARVAQLMEGVLAEMRLVFHLMDNAPQFHEPYLERNLEIVAALERGERSAAARLLRDYLADAEQQLISAITPAAR